MDGYGRSSGGGVLGAFFIGGIIGFVLGILFAPRSGEETRQMVSDRAQEYWNQGVDAYEDAMGKVNEAVGQGRETVAGTAADLSDKVGAAREKLRAQAGDVTPKAHEAIDTAAEKAKGAVGAAAEKGAGAADAALGKTQETLADVAQRVKTGDVEKSVEAAKGAAAEAAEAVAKKNAGKTEPAGA